MNTGIYLYAVLLKQQDITFYLKEAGLGWVENNDLQLVYKEVDPVKLQSEIEKASKDLTAIKKLLQDHEKVVEGLSRFEAVIPFRFGTVLKDVSAALNLLKEKGNFFKSSLKKLQGKEEWGIRLYSAGKKKNLKPPQSAEEYLMKIKQETSGSRKSLETVKDAANELMKETKGLSAKVSIRNTGRQIKSSVLIDRKDRNNFKSKILSFKRKYQPKGVNLEVSGPWPPYSFI